MRKYDARDGTRTDRAGGTLEDTGTPNDEHIDVWNEILAPKFKRFRHILAGSFERHSQRALEQYGPTAGQRALDVACGFGETTLELARRVGPKGHVLGVDCCEAFVEVGRADAQHAELRNVQFEVVDAQSHRFEPIHDLVFSRFGTMFFASPALAMRNLRGALRPGGRLLIIVWRSTDDNEWVALPKAIARERLPPPPDGGPSCGPGPFSMADSETVAAILGAAGYADIGFERVDVPMMIGATPEEAAAFQLQIGPAGELMREAASIGEERRPAIEAALHRALEAHRTAEGVVMRSSSWTVTARNPG